MIILLDNYDSFTYNLYQYLGDITTDIKVIRNDVMTAEEILALKPSHIIISPGPKRPHEAGCLEDLIRLGAGKVPILGICLGHQGMGEVYGGKVVRAPYLAHGKASEVEIDTNSKLFKNLPSRIEVGRYHSLIVDQEGLSTGIKVVAKSDDGLIMAIEHKDYPVYGIQFHPESVLTPLGMDILKNFLAV